MGSIWQDLRFGVRLLTTERQFTAVAVLVLALGVGLPTAVFSIVNAVLLRPLPYAEPAGLVAVTSVFRTAAGAETQNRTVVLDDLEAWRPHLTRLTAVSAFAYTQLPVRVERTALSPVTALLDPEFLPLLGAGLVAGRHFTTAPEDRQGAIVSHRLWASAFGGSADAIGRRLLVDGEPYQLIGVLPDGFQFPRSDASYFTEPVDLLILAASFPNFPSSSRQWFGIGRLAAGSSLVEAQAELRGVAAGAAAPRPDGGRWTPSLAPLGVETTRRARAPLLIVLGISIVLLLVAATNLMNLYFARSISRVREMAIRRAIGSTSGRLVRQLLTEALLIALLGGAAGVWVAQAVIGAAVRLSPFHLPVSGNIDIDWRVLAFTLGAGTAATLAASLLPAFHLSATSAQASRSGGVRTTAGRGVARVQRGLCAAQIALGVVLLSTGGLLANSLWRLGSVDPGFVPDRVFGFNVAVPTDQPMPQRIRFYASALDAIRTIPGVERAGLISFLPPETRAGVFMGIAIDGIPPAGDAPRVVNTLVTSRDYFDTVQMPLVRGRPFGAADTAAGRPVVIVNEALARRYFGAADPIGRLIGTGFDGLKPIREIVGVVADAHDRGLQTAPFPTAYLPFEQFSLPYASLAVRTSGPPAAIIPVVHDRLRAIDAGVPITEVQTLDDRLYESLREPRFYTVAAVACAALAMLFVTFGLYGLISYSVSRRTAEFGIRMALGAERQSILSLVLLQGVRLAAAGAALGLLLAALSTRALESLLFEVEPLDPITLAAAALSVVTVSVAACVVPALRASRLEPLRALRHD
jgi:putative ABC transport system permease protein